MYRWPAGRIIRLIVFALAAAIAADFAYHGIQQLIVWSDAVGDKKLLRDVIIGGVFVAVAAAVIVTALVTAGFKSKTVDFLIEVEEEMTRVEWPAWPQIWKTTVVVSILMAILSATTFGVDMLFRQCIQWLIKLGGGA